MNFELDQVCIEQQVRSCSLAVRVLTALPADVPVSFVADGREIARPEPSAPDAFGAGKRRMVVMRRRSPFLMACPAGSAQFACCGYLVLNLASNCPMDCSYCFLQDYLAGNPAFQLYANLEDAFEELDNLIHKAPGRHFRVGTGELADSLAFDHLTGLSRDLVEFFSRRDGLMLELKTKTDEVRNLLELDPRGKVTVSWTLSPDRVYQSSEHRSASPRARLEAARKVAAAGYNVAFHLDPIIAYPGAEKDYLQLLDCLFDTLAPPRISFISMGGLRMTPALRAAARRRFPEDPMLAGEEVLSPDGRYRTFAPLRLRLYRSLKQRIESVAPRLMTYLCMEPIGVAERLYRSKPPHPAGLGELLATAKPARAG